jgi:hypothetical protein
MAGLTGDDRRVLEYGEEVLTRDPGNLGARLDMAASADRLGLADVAQWILEEAKAKAPRDLAVCRALARLTEKRGDVSRALALWEEVTRADPADFGASRHLRNLSAAAALSSSFGRKPGSSPERGNPGPG